MPESCSGIVRGPPWLRGNVFIASAACLGRQHFCLTALLLGSTSVCQAALLLDRISNMSHTHCSARTLAYLPEESSDVVELQYKAVIMFISESYFGVIFWLVRDFLYIDILASKEFSNC